MKYSKPHLNYAEQVKLLASRGMDVAPEREAVAALRRIGYYRLSAYTYPMRQAAPEGGAERRSSDYVEGAKLTDAVALHDFDHRLRRALLPALQTLEVGLRTKVAYTLGKNGPMAHLERAGLDSRQCNTANPRSDRTKYEEWRQGYEDLQAKAAQEEYVRHFTLKYDGEVPIWAATEFMTMGNLIRLYRLLNKKDGGIIATDLGVKNQEMLHGWLKALTVLRNNCAHNSRLWNRGTVYPPKVNDRMVGVELHHLSEADSYRIYYLAALLAYLLRAIDPESRFPNDFVTTMNKFPSVLGMTPETTMGFVEGWRGEALWRTS